MSDDHAKLAEIHDFWDESRALLEKKFMDHILLIILLLLGKDTLMLTSLRHTFY